MGGEVGPGIGSGDGVTLEIGISYWNGLEIWKKTGLGLGLKVRNEMGFECSGEGLGIMIGTGQGVPRLSVPEGRISVPCLSGC